jgi:ankyrin repeat protein
MRFKRALITLLACSHLHADPQQEANKNLLHGAYFGFSEIVISALTNGAAPDCEDEERRTPLMLAALMDYPEIVTLLLGGGAQADHGLETGQTALLYAAYGSSVECVKILLAAGATPTLNIKTDVPWWNNNNHLELDQLIIKALINNKGDEAFKTYSPLPVNRKEKVSPQNQPHAHSDIPVPRDILIRSQPEPNCCTCRLL